MDTCKQMQVIETTLSRRGKGIVDDPVRVVTQYWSLDGALLAEVDPCKPRELESYSTKALMEELIRRGGVTHCIVEPDEKIHGQCFDTDGHVSNNAKKIQIHGPAHILIIG